MLAGQSGTSEVPRLLFREENYGLIGKVRQPSQNTKPNLVEKNRWERFSSAVRPKSPRTTDKPQNHQDFLAALNKDGCMVCSTSETQTDTEDMLNDQLRLDNPKFDPLHLDTQNDPFRLDQAFEI